MPLVKDLILKLNYDWYKKKNEFFLKEGLYDPTLGRIHDSFLDPDFVQIGEDEWKEEVKTIVVDVDINKYCWSCIFYGSNAERRFDDESIYYSDEFPIDSSEVANDIVRLIYKSTEKFISVGAIDAFIKDVVNDATQTVATLKNNSTDGRYKEVLSDFLTRLRQELTDEFSHIKQQVNLEKKQAGVDRKLTLELTSRIAKFKLKNKRFITSVEGSLEEGAALLQLLSHNDDGVVNFKIRIEDWANKDVFYLLTRLIEVITDPITIGRIESKKALFLRTGKLFSRGTYDPFKSQKLEDYIATNPNKVVIDDFLASLF